MLVPLHKRSRLLLMGQRQELVFLIPGTLSDGYDFAGTWDAVDPRPGVCVIGSTYNWMGYSYSVPPNYYRAGFRFFPVTLPQGTVVKDARLRVRSVLAFSGVGMNAMIRAHAGDNSASFVPCEDIWYRTRTAAGVLWQPGAWVADGWHDSPNIAAVVQEVLNRPGWVAGNGLTVFVDATSSSNNYRYVWTWDRFPTQGSSAKLIVQI